MPAPRHISKKIAERVLGDGTLEQQLQHLERLFVEQKPLPPRLPAGNVLTEEAVVKRQKFLASQGISIPHVSRGLADMPLSNLEGNIENLVGFASMPIGVIGPLRINGSSAQGDYYVPLATSEGALIASINRGAYTVSQSGGVSVVCLTESVSRAPCFMFESIRQAGSFLAWMIDRSDEIQEVVSTTSSHCKFQDLKVTLTGKEVFLILEYTTGDAAGQNMVTIATQAVCKHLVEHAPIKPKRWYVEGNLSGDKKATMMAFLYARGKKVVAEATVKREVLCRFVHIAPEEMVRYWQISFLGGSQSGSIGVQGHYANALAGLFIACGQDAACVSEASVGVTRMDVTEDGDLYTSVSLPNLIVGTVGGGTHLPTARECLEMLGCYGSGCARKFAEITAAVVLAGEISIIGALASGDFSKAHETYGRKKTCP